MVQKKGERLVANSLLFLVAAILIYSSANDFNFGGNSITGFQVAGAGLNPVLSSKIVVVGASKFNGVNGTNVGKVYVYNLDGTLRWTKEGENSGYLFGESVSSAGDVNGDGLDDVIVGARAFINFDSDRDKVYVYSGVNGRLLWEMEGEQPGDRFGESVSSDGDVNGDGYDDVIVGARDFGNFDSSRGKVYVYSGVNGRLLWEMEGEQQGSQLGRQVSSADVNGDGLDDVIVGAPRFNGVHEQDRGKVYVYSNTGRLLWTKEGENSGYLFGESVSSAGDVDGDGYDDVIIGAYGKVYVYSNAGILLWEMEGENSVDYFGRSVSSAGDVDGDGYDDVIIGAPWFDNGYGRGKIYIRKGLNGAYITTIEGENLEDFFGSSVSSAGNIDNSYGDDVIIGAPWFDNGNRRGKIYVYSGISTQPPLGTLLWAVEGENSWDYFGESVSGSPS